MVLDIEYQIKGQAPYLHTHETNEDMEVEIREDGNRHIVIIKAKKDLILTRGKIDDVHEFDDDDIFPTNGYQSWTDTAERRFGDKSKEKDVKRLPKILLKTFGFDRYGDATFYPYKPDTLHGYNIFYIKGKKQLFSFNYNFEKAYVVYEINNKTRKLAILSDVYGQLVEKGEKATIYDLYYGFDYEQGHQTFCHDCTPRKAEKVFGYTSWYNYYQNINESIILRDLEGLDKRFNLFQIDDGYETFVGDWLDIDKNKFPNGLEPIVKKIHEKGYKAGIWLAPFVAEEKSQLFKNHKELFKRDKKGNLIKAGGNWSGFYLLDLENKDTKAYIEKCLKYFIDLGFDFFKLDFLYAVTLPRYYHLTKAQVTNNAYKFIKDVLKDKLILGCGAIPSTSSQYFDYLRVGPDVSLKFDDVWFMRFAHRERISTKVTIQNTIYRSIFDKHLFLNDPDVFLLRSDNISLNDKQKEALLTINALFGSVLMTSDNIASYDEKSKVLLEKAFELFYTAKVINYERENDYIHIEYKINDNVYKITYNTMKGELTNGR